MSFLDEWGSSAERVAAFERRALPGSFPARVSSQHRDRYEIWSERGEIGAEVSGRMRHDTQDPLAWPTVGDWVVATGGSPAVLHEVLPRASLLARRAAGAETRSQAIAANLDHVLIVTSLNQELNARRLERLLTIVWESGAKPGVVLNKADLAVDPAETARRLGVVLAGVPVLVASALTGRGVAEIAALARPGVTIALVGSSGVGKSSLVNRLVGEERLDVRAIRERDDRGRHTTTHRQLVRLPAGGVLVDTPGMRLVGMLGHDEGFGETFSEVETAAQGCKFRDCRHENEPGCAVRQAVEEGVLDAGRVRNFHRLRRELAYEARREDQRARALEWRRHRAASRSQRRLTRSRQAERG